MNRKKAVATLFQFTRFSPGSCVKAQSRTAHFARISKSATLLSQLSNRCHRTTQCHCYMSRENEKTIAVSIKSSRADSHVRVYALECFTKFCRSQNFKTQTYINCFLFALSNGRVE
jgi:hypothetical protein